MVTWARAVLCVVSMLGGATRLNAQAISEGAGTVTGVTLVDSLLAAGWRMPGSLVDTVQLVPDTVIVAGERAGAWIPVVAFAVGMLALAGLGLLTFLTAARLLRAIDGRSMIGVRSHWGGIGGGNAGWEVSPALSLAAVTIIFAILTTVVATSMLSVADRSDSAGNAEAVQETG